MEMHDSLLVAAEREVLIGAARETSLNSLHCRGVLLSAAVRHESSVALGARQIVIVGAFARIGETVVHESGFGRGDRLRDGDARMVREYGNRDVGEEVVYVCELTGHLT